MRNGVDPAGMSLSEVKGHLDYILMVAHEEVQHPFGPKTVAVVPFREWVKGYE